MTDHYEMPHARADECPHAGVGKACRPCRNHFDYAPITPDERAAMRALADTATEGPWAVDGFLAPGPGDSFTIGPADGALAYVQPVWADAEFIAAARTAVPRLLDALDTAEAEVARLRAERTAAHADDATCASCTHEYVADMERRAEDAEAKVERQRDRLRAREEQVRRLRAEVTRLHALVADLRAATSPAWDEDTVREAGAQALTAVYERYGDNYLPDEEEMVDAVLAVVRRHLPVSGESRATVQAEALRAAADAMDADPEVRDPLRLRSDWLRARADRIEKEK